MAHVSIEKAVKLYFRHKGWATPKELVNQLYPIFKKQYHYHYDRETLRRLIHRVLNKTPEIIRHTLKPFYVHRNSLDWFNFLISQLAKRDRLEILYNEGMTILFSGKICVEYPCSECGDIKKEFHGKVIHTPSIPLKEPAKSRYCLLIVKRDKNEELESWKFPIDPSIDKLCFDLRKMREVESF